MECLDESLSDMEELSESQKECNTEETDIPCLTEEGAAVITDTGDPDSFFFIKLCVLAIKILSDILY